MIHSTNGTGIGLLGARDDATIRISKKKRKSETVEVTEVTEVVKAVKFLDASEVLTSGESPPRTSESFRFLN